MHTIIDCFNAQTYRDFEVIFVVDKHFA
jgi:glycosyltransferase involved in cell wall biosynthesis